MRCSLLFLFPSLTIFKVHLWLIKLFGKPGRYDYKKAEKELEAYHANPAVLDHLEKARNRMRRAVKGYPRDHPKTGLAYLTIANCGWTLADRKSTFDNATLDPIITAAREADDSWPQDDRESPNYALLCANTGTYYRTRYVNSKQEEDRNEALRYHTKAWDIASKQESDDLTERHAINNQQKSAAIELATTRRMICEVHCGTPEELGNVIKDLERALDKGDAKDRAHPVGLRELGIALELRESLFPGRGDGHRSAITHFKKAIDLFEGRPHDQAVVLDRLASALELQGSSGDFDEALGCLDRAIRLVGTQSSASSLRYRRANLLWAQYSSKYASIQELETNSPTTLSSTELGRTQKTTEPLRKAITDYEEAIKDLPSDQKIRALFNVSAIHFGLYSMPEAKEPGDWDLERANEKGQMALDLWEKGGHPSIMVIEGEGRSLEKKALEELLDQIREPRSPASPVSPATPAGRNPKRQNTLTAHTPVSARRPSVRVGSL